MVHCADAGVPELVRLVRTIDAWRDELLAYFDTGGVSNGPTEAMNPLIKKIKRTGHGFRNFENYRPPPPPALRSRLAHSTTNTDQRPVTTVDCVERLNPSGAATFITRYPAPHLAELNHGFILFEPWRIRQLQDARTRIRV